MPPTLPISADPSSDALVMRAKTDRDALGQLYDQLYPTIFRFCIRRVHNRARAEDLSSSVFMNVATKIGTFSGRTYEDFRRWVFAIANNEINAEYRKSSRRETLLLDAAESGLVGGADNSDNEEEADVETLQHAIMQLGERDQSIITMRYFAELSYENIGRILELTPGAVRTAASRAVERIKKQMEAK